LGTVAVLRRWHGPFRLAKVLPGNSPTPSFDGYWDRPQGKLDIIRLLRS